MFKDPETERTDIFDTIASYLDEEDLNRLPEFPRTSLDQLRRNTYRIDPMSWRTTDPPLLTQEDFNAGKSPSIMLS